MVRTSSTGPMIVLCLIEAKILGSDSARALACSLHRVRSPKPSSGGRHSTQKPGSAPKWAWVPGQRAKPGAAAAVSPRPANLAQGED